jgi:hypothetical protein
MALRHTNSYLAFKTEAERLTNFVALISHAVPVLKRVMASSEASALIPIKPADNFPHDKSTESLLSLWATNYSQDLAHIIVLAVFSQFEAYVRGALAEIYERQGGPEAFLSPGHGAPQWMAKVSLRGRVVGVVTDYSGGRYLAADAVRR